MRKLSVYDSVSIDGYFTDVSGDMSWAHQMDPEWQDFVSENAKGGGELVFGRLTYDMMASFWPTPAGTQMNSVVAERMNSLPKIVFSRKMKKALWNNTRLINGDLTTEVKKLKKEPGPDMVIMGSGNLISQLADLGLIDRYQIVLTALALGNGRTLFDGISKTLPLKLLSSRTFKNGNVVLSYEPKS